LERLSLLLPYLVRFPVSQVHLSPTWRQPCQPGPGWLFRLLLLPFFRFSLLLRKERLGDGGESVNIYTRSMRKMYLRYFISVKNLRFRSIMSILCPNYRKCGLLAIRISPVY